MIPGVLVMIMMLLDATGLGLGGMDWNEYLGYTSTGVFGFFFGTCMHDF
jgi:hypothetical protein